MPSPHPHPTKNKRKGRNYFPNTPQRLHNSWQDMQIIRLKKQKQKQKNKQKTSLQTSRHLSSILAGLKIKPKDQGRSRGKCCIILGSPWLVYHFSHRTRYRYLVSGFAFPVGHLLPKSMTAGTLEPRLLSLYSLIICIHT